MTDNLKLEKILPLVQRPGRYIGCEWNTHQPAAKDVAVCFCFPDVYEVGASNLGIEILYHLVNGSDHAVAERCYCPSADLEEVLRRDSLPLFSLESKRPLAGFDLVGFSLQYELCATNVLNMLDLAGIPQLSKDRTALFPLVIGGGPMTANPEPVADFFDLFLIGEGEEAILEITAAVRDFKRSGSQDRAALLLQLAKIPGVYVPSFYDVAYNDDGTVRSVTPNRDGVPAQVVKRTVKLEEVPFPSRQIVPYVQTVHNRLNIEIARGCPGQCRFCQASKYYWPWRLRSSDKILALAEEGLGGTGYEEISLSSLSCTDYRGLDRLLDEVNRRFGAKRINVTIPSLRCDRFSLQVAGNLGYNKRASLTFAPEAGTDRLRYVIGKNLLESEIQETLVLAWRMGWRLVKLYFMIGLPTETDEDIEGIRSLVRSVRRTATGLNFNVTVSPFVPKAQTPFQWVAMTQETTIRERMRSLEKNLSASVKGHYVETSLLEGVFARGDRRLSAVILNAWRRGCRFDQWKEQLRPELWQAAFAEAGVDRTFYLYRERGADETLPWEHLVFGVEKAMLWTEYQKIFTVQVPTEKPAKETPAALPAPVVNTTAAPTTQRLRLRFGRTGELRYLSHLEQIEVLRRAIRRSGLPVGYTAGFSPQIKVAFGPAISVGYESRSEYIELDLVGRVEPAEVQLRFGKCLPAGMELLSVRKIPLLFPSLDSLVNVADYHIGVSVSPEQIERFLAQESIVIEKRKKDRVDRIDVKPLIRELRSDEHGIFLQLRFGPKRNVKPEKVLQALLNMDEDRVKLIPISRTALFIEKKDGSVSEP